MLILLSTLHSLSFLDLHPAKNCKSFLKERKKVNKSILKLVYCIKKKMFFYVLIFKMKDYFAGNLV